MTDVRNEKALINCSGSCRNLPFYCLIIAEAYGPRPDLLIYAGLRAEKYLANAAPENDMALIRQAEDNIRRIAPQKLVLISTVDVFKFPKGVDEDSPWTRMGCSRMDMTGTSWSSGRGNITRTP